MGMGYIWQERQKLRDKRHLVTQYKCTSVWRYSQYTSIEAVVVWHIHMRICMYWNEVPEHIHGQRLRWRRRRHRSIAAAHIQHQHL